MKINNLWKRLNHLCIDPICTVRDDELMGWSDPRTQPTEVELLAVDMNVIDEKDTTIVELQSEMNNHDFFLFKMILEIYEVGVAKGVWAATDFPTALKNKVIAIKQNLQKL